MSIAPFLGRESTLWGVRKGFEVFRVGRSVEEIKGFVGRTKELAAQQSFDGSNDGFSPTVERGEVSCEVGLACIEISTARWSRKSYWHVKGEGGRQFG